MSLHSASTRENTSVPGEMQPSERRARAWYRRITLSPYLVLSLAAVAYACLAAYRQPWGNDFGMHAAVVEQLRQDPLHPADPMVDADGQNNPYYTPYTVLLGLIARLAGWSGITTLGVVTPVCVALLLYGVYRFVRIFTANRWTPVVALVLLFLLWGEGPPAWSGFLNLRGLPRLIPYPSTLALGLTLLWWAYLWKALDRPQLRRWILAGGFFGVIVIVHSFTAVGATLGAVALGLHRLRALRPHLVASALVAAIATMLAWPYYSLIDVMSATGDLNPIHQQLYLGVPQIYTVPLVLCAPALVLRFRRNRLDPLGWLFILTFAVVLVGWVTGNWALGRVWPVVMVAAQVALAIELVSLVSSLRPTPDTPGRLGNSRWRDAGIGGWAVLTAVACGWGFSTQHNDATELLRLDRPIVAFADRDAWITDRVAPGDVMLADGSLTEQRWLSRDLIAHRIRFVAPPWPDPTLPDEKARESAVRELMAPETPESRRRELLDHYQVRWIMDTRDELRWADAYAVETIAGPGRQRLLRLG